jgi:hypothetical protein
MHAERGAVPPRMTPAKYRRSGLFLASIASLATGCAVMDGDTASDDHGTVATTEAPSRATVGNGLAAADNAVCPPEPTTLDPQGQPRNAAGKIRFCWPGEAKCYCDADRDCYAQTGYVACSATTTPTPPPPATKSVTYTASPSPGVVNQRTTVTATSTGFTSARYRFWAVTPSGQWTQPCGDYSTSASCAFTPTTTGAWKIAVSARESTSTANFDATSELPYTVGTAPTQPPPTDPPPTQPPPSDGSLPAFPGAEGFGARATGGRGGRVIYVTNLNTSGPGSLQDALNQTGKRYILFKVSGVINGSMHVRNGDFTLAGQTSPGGIIVRGFHTTEQPFCNDLCGPLPNAPTNWIARHLRSRPGQFDYDDGLRLRHTRNAIVDHFSLGNANDEAVEISFSNDLTIQNTLLAETLGDHANLGGMLLNYTNPKIGFELDRISIHHNTWNRIMGRQPELSRESGALAAGTTMQIEVSNNLRWDPYIYMDVNNFNQSGGNEGSPILYALNFIGNYTFARPDFRFGLIGMTGGAQSGTSFYLNDNQMNLYPSRRDWQMVYCCNDYPNAAPQPVPSWARSTRFPYPAITYTPSSELRDYMIKNVGAFPRDAMDRRLMASVINGVIDPAPRNVNPANDAWIPPPSSPPPVDTDGDGMPDAWEIAHGLDPNAQDHNGTQLSVPMTGVAGYTNLECYLNELSDKVVAGK